MVGTGYESDMDALGTLLKDARLAAGLTQRAVGEHFGINRVSVAQWESGDTRPEADKLGDLAELLRITPAALLASYNSDEPVAAAPNRTRVRGQPIVAVPASELVAPNQRLPVYSGAQGGRGKLIVSSEIVDRVEMPAQLKDVHGAYGLMVDGSSMEPEFWPGDVVWINPHLRASRGKNHVLYHTPPFGEDAEAIIKRVNGWNDREWDLEQWNPAKKFKEFRQEWPICHRVVGKYDAT